MPSFGNFMHTQFVLKIPKPSVSFASKTVIITGASSGLGKEAAKHIVRLGAARVILACRNISKGNEAKLEIEATQRCSPDILEVWPVDIESPPSVKEFVERVNKLPRVDVIINNAGMQTIKYQTAYGTGRTIGVNVIGTFLLALQLIPKLKETAKTYGVSPQLTFLGSALYDVAKLPENDGGDLFGYFSDPSHVKIMDQNQYNLSKLLLLYIVIKLASIVDPATTGKSQNSHSVVINSLDPCFCKTGLAGELTGGFKAVFKFFEFVFARPAEEGSRLVVIAASAGRPTHGKYMRAGSVQEYAPFITNVDGQAKMNYVWEQLSRKLETIQPGVMANVNTA
ncbi:hypothetical protein DL95DRAFT_437522 [Leptodontidium sp. 2 PMI_412]|nr:hypothetical protein DL95DRAFT_437522 [Leptodontidium sp. 2 PMI_412]